MKLVPLHITELLRGKSNNHKTVSLLPSFTINNFEIHIDSAHKHVALKRQLIYVHGGKWLSNSNKCIFGIRKALGMVSFHSSHTVYHLKSKNKTKIVSACKTV